MRLRDYISRTVVVHLPGRSLRGVLTGVHRDCFVLEHVELLSENEDDTPLAGHVVLERPLPAGSFIQAQ